jgi:hypothetical protein
LIRGKMFDVRSQRKTRSVCTSPDHPITAALAEQSNTEAALAAILENPLEQNDAGRNTRVLGEGNALEWERGRKPEERKEREDRRTSARRFVGRPRHFVRHGYRFCLIALFCPKRRRPNLHPRKPLLAAVCEGPTRCCASLANLN